ncbi:hypothetical protein AVEN_263147-1 [Araneus ventricosus]|uniref:Uncharacterized protein n=1 Tax=Araneus ventricosus TaxID=182803 RepID=A0A4Y2F7Q5_ARAVE|nr:hypothetical protein AVEN_263147-1 [Araneus ventricosus]
MDMGPLSDRTPPKCLLPLQLPNQLDGTRDHSSDTEPFPCPVLLPLQLPNRLDGHPLRYRTPPHAPCMIAITATEPVGWTWDHR